MWTENEYVWHVSPYIFSEVHKAFANGGYGNEKYVANNLRRRYCLPYLPIRIVVHWDWDKDVC